MKLTGTGRILLWACGLLTAGDLWAQSGVPNQPQSLAATGVTDLRGLAPTLSGKGVQIALVERSAGAAGRSDCAFLPNLEHQALRSANIRFVYFYDQADRELCYSPHASLIAGLLFGADSQARTDELGFFAYTGSAPQASYDIYESCWFIRRQILAPAPLLIHNDVISLSWGTDDADAFTQWWQRGLDALAERDGNTIVAGCGNGNAKFRGIARPSWGYNIISVGSAEGLGAFPENLRYVGGASGELTSFGPTDDGRAKPDCVAPGAVLGPAAESNSGYVRDSGANCYSSFAAPQVAGVAALLIEAARQGGNAGADDPRLIKALILNGANKLAGWHKGECGLGDDTFVPLDFHQGAGLVNAANSYRQLQAGAYDPNNLKTSGWLQAEVDLAEPNHAPIVYLPAPSANQPVKATLCWYRHYQPNRLFAPRELSHLTLELWALDEAGNLAQRLDLSASPLDNVQHIYYPAAAASSLALKIVPAPGQTGRETFALAFTVEEANWAGDRLAADINADGVVDFQDLLLLLSSWGRQEPTPRGGLVADFTWFPQDLNLDGKIDAGDLTLLYQNWQNVSPWKK